MGTKNNPANRGQASKGKEYAGKEVKPVLYMGAHVGHGKYVAAQYDNGDLVTEDDGSGGQKPVMWDAI
tara:strand:- start:40 stop:243 length:204 start_codon:yes stop_codon:yes gene_type:complete